MFGATVLSPIVGVIAIIVALIIAHGSSKDTNKQIKGIYNLLDVYIASQNPIMIELKRNYEMQLEELNSQIRNAEDDLNTVHYSFYGRGARIDDIMADEEDAKRREKLNNLLNAKKEIEIRLNSINLYLQKVAK